MDKSKNRTDLLAAGRKRLQQFRQKKDHKGGGKSSSKAGRKPEKEADAEDPADAHVDSTAAGGERAVEEVPVELDHPEGNHAGPEQCNAEAEGQTHNEDHVAGSVASETDGSKEILIATSCTLAELSHDGEDVQIGSSERLEVGEDFIAGSASEREATEIVHKLSALNEARREGEEVATASLGKCFEAVEESAATPHSFHEDAEETIQLSVSMERSGGDGEVIAISSESLEVDGDSTAASSSKNGAGEDVDGLAAMGEESHVAAPGLMHDVVQEVEVSSTMVEESYEGEVGRTSTDNGLEKVENSIATPSLKCEMVLEVNGLSALDGGKHKAEEGLSSTSESLEMKEDSVVDSSLGHEVSQDVNGFSAPAERSGGNEVDLSMCNEGQLVGVSKTVNGAYEGHLVPEDHAVESSTWTTESTDAAASPLVRVQQPEPPTMLAGVVRETNTEPSDEDSGSISHEGSLEKLPLSEDIFASKGKDGNVSSGAEGERKVNDGGGQQHFHVEDVADTKVTLEKLTEEHFSLIEKKGDKVKEEEFSLLSKSTGWTRLPEDNLIDELESIRNHIYLTYLANDLLQLQLGEQTEMDLEFHRHSSNEVSELRNSVKETQESKVVLSEELAQCTCELRAVNVQKEELEIQCLSTKEEIDKLSYRTGELQSELEGSQEELVHLSAELTACKGSLEALQKENLNLTANLAFEVDAKRKLLEEKDHLSGENMRLSCELSEQKGRLLLALDEQLKLETALRDIGSTVEQLTEENLYLSSSLDVHKAGLQELEIKCSEVPLQAQEHVANDSVVSSVAISHAKDSLLEKCARHYSGDSTALRVTKEHLEEAENILHNLANSVQGMQSHSLTLSRSGGKRAGVSKLIQAFESKTHSDDNVQDEISFTNGERPGDSYTSTTQHISSLRAMLKQVVLDLHQAEDLVVEAENCKKLCREFEVECVTQRQKNDSLQAKIDGVFKNLSGYESRIECQQKHLGDIQQNINNETERHLSLVELLQKEVNDTLSMYRQEKESTEVAIFKALETLNASTGSVVSGNLDLLSHVTTSVTAARKAIEDLHEELQSAHLKHHAALASKDELNKYFSDLQGRYELASGLLNKVFINLKELVGHFCRTENEDINLEAEKVQQFLPEIYDVYFGQLQHLLDERISLLSTHDGLESELANRNQEIEELKRRCVDLDKMLKDMSHTNDEFESTLMRKCGDVEELNRRCLALSKKLEDHELVKDSDVVRLDRINECTLKSDNVENDLCNPVLSRLESRVELLLERYQESIQQIHLSKIYLREVNTSPEMSADHWSLPLPTLLREEFFHKAEESSYLQDKLSLLSASNIQKENEMKIINGRLREVEEALEVARSELQCKVAELEQSEERLSSVREKLSIAVAKGKGLVVQRDTLKHSLMEKSNELEKCVQELMSKQSLLHEVEAKLKSCSEVGRIEALESELSYIRNSATAMRDSFLLKDSILQKIEEVLEDLDLPEHFHSKDIVEKIELLSRMAADNSSFPITDWDQKSVVECSQSDTGGVVMDAVKDDIQSSSDTGFDDLKRKYESLHRKFYGLAEHNEMLEQSLTERNNLIQKWEEILDSIDMPLQFRVLEPEDKLECLGRMLSEVQRERDSLWHKIENLESSSDLLVADLEESHKKISELAAEIVATKSEKEFFAQSFEELRFEYLNLSEKSVQDEVERENSRRELADLQGKLEEMKDCPDLEIGFQKLNEMLVNALPECDRPDTVSSVSDFGHLEGLLRKLIDRYTTIPSGESMQKEVVIEESNYSVDREMSADVQEVNKQEVVAVRSELDEALCSLIAVKEERDATMEKFHSLMLEVDAITKQRNLLEEEKTVEAERYQSLVLELEAAHRERDYLQEQVAQEEQKSASTREKLNVAVRKGKALVQQRDSLKQTIEEMNTVVDQMKIDHNQRLEALESEKMFMTNRLAEFEESLQVSNESLNKLLTALDAIHVSSEVSIIDPVQKVEGIRKFIFDLQSALNSSEHEAKKSKRAAELLLAELNEVHERADLLQEELGKAEITISECSKQRDGAEAARIDMLSHLEQFMTTHSEEKRKHINSLVDLKSAMEQLRKGCSALASLLADFFTKNVDLFCYVETFMESILKHMDGEHVLDSSVLVLSSLPSNNPPNEETFGIVSNLVIEGPFDDSLVAEHLAHAGYSLQECIKEFDDLKGHVNKNSYSINQQAMRLSNVMQKLKGKLISDKEAVESLRRDVIGLESIIKEKDTEICSMRRCLVLLYEACNSFIAEIKNRRSQVVEGNFSSGYCVLQAGNDLKLRSYIDGQESSGEFNFLCSEENIRMVADSLASTIRESENVDERTEKNQMELKAIISDLQRELHEKDMQMNRISEELLSQIKESESVTSSYKIDLDSAKSHIHSLENQVAMLKNDRKLLDARVDELQVLEASSKVSEDKFKLLTEDLTAKDQEIESLMQALDEEESQMEDLENRLKELENMLQEKNRAAESLEASRAKAIAKLSATMNKFDELHDLSENLLAEVENLQSQLQGKDAEISFLRQEVTRCTDDVLSAQEANKKFSSVVHELLTRMGVMVSRFDEHQVHLDDEKCNQVQAYMDILDKNLESIVTELDDLRVTVKSKDAMLQIERGRVEELLRKADVLETSLREKNTQIELFQEGRDSGQLASGKSPEQLEIQQMIKKLNSPSITPHVRGGRKINNDQIAIAIDTEQNGTVLRDEDDDKAHGFKSLTLSRIVPRATRPVADRIDAIWVSGDRLLMRQPTLRLGLVIYWIALHALLASFI